MAKVTITLVDGDEEDAVGLEFTFDPPMERGADPTAAQSAAILMLGGLAKSTEFEGVELDLEEGAERS